MSCATERSRGTAAWQRHSGRHTATVLQQEGGVANALTLIALTLIALTLIAQPAARITCNPNPAGKIADGMGRYTDVMKPRKWRKYQHKNERVWRKHPQLES